MQIANQLHSFIVWHIHDIELSSLFCFPFPFSYLLSVSNDGRVQPRLSVSPSHPPNVYPFTQTQRKPTLSTTLNCDQTAGAHARTAVTHVCHHPSTGTTATLCGVVRPGEWQLCELCGMLATAHI